MSLYYSALQETPVSSGLACDLCKLAIPELEAKLKDKSTANTIEKVLHDICDKNSEMGTQCKKVVDDYLPLILDAIFQLPAEILCSDIHMCSSSKSFQTPLLKLPRNASGLTCSVCIAVATGIDSFLGNDSIQRNITYYVSQVCDILPQEATCKPILEAWIPRVIKEFVNFTPNEDCSFFGLCSPLLK
jgi:hypothetical protein